ncbi:putative RNA-directed DNA polymerase [Tanacetum coccineum]
MAMISAFTTVDKTAHNSRKFAFTLSPTNYGYWKTMIEPFLITNNLMGYVDGSIPCPSKTLSITDDATVPKENLNYPIWVSNDAYVRMLIISTISEASFHHVQGTTSRDLWLSLEKAYAPHSTSREYTFKTQLLTIYMHGDETPDAYLNRAQKYADALAAISEPVKDKDLVMLVVSGLREEYNGLKITITVRQSPTVFSELHALLSDHDYMLGKTRAPAPSITSSFAANYAVGSPSMPEARQSQLSELTVQLSALGFQVSPITPSGPQAFYGARSNNNNNNNRNNNNNNRGNRNNSRGNNNRGHGNGRQFDWASTQNTVYSTCNRCGIGHIPSQCPNRDPSTIRTRPSANFANTRAQSSNASANWHSDTGANSHVTPDLEAMDNSEAYYGDDALHVGNGKGLPILHIGSSKVYSPQKTFSLKNILHVPEISHNLLSVQKFCHDNDVFFEFHTSYFVEKDDPSSPRSPSSSPFSVSHLSPTSQTSPESSNGQPFPVSTTSIPTPPPPTPPPPPITRQRPLNLRQNPKQRVPYNPSANHATVLPTTINVPTTLRSDWVYRLKQDKNGAITRYKARFVAKDIQNAFLHGNLKEQVYMKQPLGFIDPQRPNHVCLLHKSLYGLKQSPRAWFERLSKALFDLGFKGSKMDPSLFIYSSGDTLLYILVYVDDIIVTGNNKGTIDNIICQLGSVFALKDLGTLNYFLGIEIVPHVSGILLSQKKYILELLQSAGLSNCNPVSSPMVTSSSLSLDDSTAFSNPVKYRQVVGSLQYVTLSRPDIAFAVNKVCQYMHAPTENHWSAVKRILRYLHGTVEHGMLIRRSSGSTLQAFTDVLWKGNPDTSLEAFSDADWAGDSDDRRSTGGFAIYLGSNLISWTARKQRTVSRSSTEAEYKALADTVAELTWLQALLNELGIRSSSTPILWCDNLGATYLSANPIFHARTKHVEIDYHFVREKVAQGDLRVQHISTHDQIADIFTKPLPTPRFLFLRSKLQVMGERERERERGAIRERRERARPSEEREVRVEMREMRETLQAREREEAVERKKRDESDRDLEMSMRARAGEREPTEREHEREREQRDRERD